MGHTRKRSERPSNRKAREIPRTQPKGERMTDIGSHQQPTIQQIIERTVRRLQEQQYETRGNLVESFEEFDNWETDDIDSDFTDHPRAETIDMTEERYRSIPPELLPVPDGKADQETDEQQPIPLSSTEDPTGSGDQAAPA